MYIGYLTSYVGDKVYGLGFCDVSSHFAKHIVRYVLQSHIEIVAHVWVVGYGSRQIFWEMCGVGVVKPQPLDSVDFSESVDKTSYRRFAVKVASVVCKVLGYEIELFYTPTHQTPYLVLYVFDATRAMPACDDRYCAVRTLTIAAFRYFHVCQMVRRGDKSFVFE